MHRGFVTSQMYLYIFIVSCYYIINITCFWYRLYQFIIFSSTNRLTQCQEPTVVFFLFLVHKKSLFPKAQKYWKNLGNCDSSEGSKRAPKACEGATTSYSWPHLAGKGVVSHGHKWPHASIPPTLDA